MTVFARIAPKPTLPLELVETVIAFLSSESKSLRAASLTSRTWVSICRAHLFRRIVLHWCDEGSRRSDSLYTLLTRNPRIAKYIHELSIHEGLISSKHSHITFCFAQSSTLPKLLPLLPQLHHIEFRASTLTPWCELNEELVHALMRTIATSSALKEVVLGSWNFASQLGALDALLTVIAKNATTLSLTDIATPFELAHSQALVARRYSEHLQCHATLQSLVINEGEVSSLPFYTNWFLQKPTRIRCLHLTCSTMQMNVSEFLSVLGELLEHLELNVRTGTRYEALFDVNEEH
ncbi:hypothetical protein NP233_g2062 [Leucocoprinus birnbaumii]|uniref:F-box domain-containing protein n=1 Tax=Leucocoprinus birnbaumii TaxID=56174 RepID=A0AAD5VZ04_9AGAR|nr:hypothetical protein NP233_g2062 [Leucocoprinus birnbaumii]